MCPTNILWAKSLFPVAQASLSGSSTCGCNSSWSRSETFKLQFRSWWVFIVRYIRFIRGSCCVGKRMNPFAWIFAAINQRPYSLSGLWSTACAYGESFSALIGSCHIWQKNTFRHEDWLLELSFIYFCGSHLSFLSFITLTFCPGLDFYVAFKSSWTWNEIKGN